MRETMRLKAGDMAPLVAFAPLAGSTVRADDDPRPLHLQFRRFAGCPICHLHLRSFVRRAAELRTHVRELVFFHSEPEELRAHLAHLPMAVVADPQKVIYAAFGVESGAGSLLHPSAIIAALKGSAMAIYHLARGEQAPPALAPTGGRLGLPADFLLDHEGKVVDCHYGVHADDQWSVDDVILRAIATERTSSFSRA